MNKFKPPKMAESGTQINETSAGSLSVYLLTTCSGVVGAAKVHPWVKLADLLLAGPEHVTWDGEGNQ